MNLKKWLYKLRYPSPYDEMLTTLDSIEEKRASIVPPLQRLRDGTPEDDDKQTALEQAATIQREYNSIAETAEEANLTTLDEDTRTSVENVQSMAEEQEKVFETLQEHVEEDTVDELEQHVIQQIMVPK